MDILYQRHFEKIAQINVKTIRDFEQKVDWNNRFIGIKGSRGVGKTTMLLQHIKQNYKSGLKALYISLDHFWFTQNRLYFLAEEFYKKGGELLVLDEVHRYNDWAVELKNIYDDFTGLKIIFTGSSLLQIDRSKSDLSRRAVMYQMPGLSFREFLNFEQSFQFQTYSLSEIIENHIEIAVSIIEKIKPFAYFSEYLKIGYYPYYLENKNSFHLKLSETILTVLEIDIPQYESIQPSHVNLLKKLLQIVSDSVPFKPNYQTISERSGISINTIKNYFQYLAKAQVISLLYSEKVGINSLGKPEKIYLQNTNLIYNLTGYQPDIGNLRETFFMNNISSGYLVSAVGETDFLVDRKYYFEIGGINKKKKQIKNLTDAFVVKDNIEFGNNNIIPLWLFGFLD